jgi:hypothetical protein
MVSSDVPASTEDAGVLKDRLFQRVYDADASATTLNTIAVPTTDDVETKVVKFTFSGVVLLLAV